MGKPFVQSNNRSAYQKLIQGIADENQMEMKQQTVLEQAKFMNLKLNNAQLAFALYKYMDKMKIYNFKSSPPTKVGDNIEAFYVPSYADACRLGVVYGNRAGDKERRLKLAQDGWDTRRLRNSVTPAALNRGLYRPFDFAEFYTHGWPELVTHNPSAKTDAMVTSEIASYSISSNEGFKKTQEEQKVSNQPPPRGSFRDYIMEHYEELDLREDYDDYRDPPDGDE